MIRSVLLFCFLTANLLADPSARDFFDEGVVQEISLTMDPNDWATLQKNFLDNTYYQASFTWRGISLNVGVRSRGRGSRSPDKPNLDVNIDKYVNKQTFLGLEFFILKANNQDASTMHERIAFKLFQRMGLPAPREAAAKVTVNGQLMGLYTIVEHEDKEFLERNFGENDGYLYEWKPEAVYRFENLGTDPSLYSQFLDPKTHEDDTELEPFVEMVQAINQTTASDADYIHAVSQYLDAKLYLTHAAIENVLSEIDGIWGDTYGMNNFYLYRFEDQKLSQLIVWDKDLTFQDPNHDILAGADENVLGKRLMAIPEYRNTYMNALVKAANLLGGPGGWAEQEINREYAVIRDAAYADPHKQCISAQGSLYACGPQDFENEVQRVRDFLRVRSNFVLTQAARLGYQTSPADPSLAQAAVVLAPADAAGQLAPGALVSIYGRNLGPTGQASAAPLPRLLGNTFVAVNGARAPLLYVSGTQANVQIPWDLPPAGTASIVVSVGGTLSNTLDLTISPVAPSILAVAHADGSAVDAQNPALSGETLVAYTAGLGDVNTAVATGSPAPSNPLAVTSVMPEMAVGGAAAPVSFSGLTPGYVGLYQVNFTLPGSLPEASLVPIELKTGGKSVKSGVNIR